MSKKKRKDKEKRRRKHTRVIDTFTGPLERPTLLWLAAHMPRWVTPDKLSGFSFLGALLTSAGYVFSRQNSLWLWPAALGFVIHWFGDSLDGTVARYRHIERPRYGFFIDHSLDAFSTTLILFSLGVSPYMRFEIAAVALAGYLLLSIYAVLTTYVADEFKISYAYLGPTEVRIIAIACSIVVYFNGTRFVHLFGGVFTFYELITLGLIVLFYTAFILSSANQAIILSKKEPTPSEPAHSPPLVSLNPSPKASEKKSMVEGKLPSQH
jgi:archaetidylinositol phosphate synthase